MKKVLKALANVEWSIYLPFAVGITCAAVVAGAGIYTMIRGMM